MNVFFYRIILILFFALLQISFFDILFPWFRAPVYLVLVVVVVTLTRGFPQALFFTVPLTLLVDAVTLGIPSWFSLYAVFLAYGTSFLSRRLLLTHQGFGLLLYALVAFGSVLFYQAVFSFFVYQDIGPSLSLQSLWPRGTMLLLTFVTFLPIFVISYFGMRHFEEYVKRLGQEQFRGIR